MWYGSATMENKNLMKTYIIRIYRHDMADSRFIVGTVEKVGVHGKMAFSNRDELWEIIGSGKNRTDKPGKGVITENHGKPRSSTETKK